MNLFEQKPLISADSDCLPLCPRPMESPCVKICTYDPDARLCRGCGRTLEEIGAWSSMSEGERRMVMENLPERLRRMSSPAS